MKLFNVVDVKVDTKRLICAKCGNYLEIKFAVMKGGGQVPPKRIAILCQCENVEFVDYDEYLKMTELKS